MCLFLFFVSDLNKKRKVVDFYPSSCIFSRSCDLVELFSNKNILEYNKGKKEFIW